MMMNNVYTMIKITSDGADTEKLKQKISEFLKDMIYRSIPRDNFGHMPCSDAEIIKNLDAGLFWANYPPVIIVFIPELFTLIPKELELTISEGTLLNDLRDFCDKLNKYDNTIKVEGSILYEGRKKEGNEYVEAMGEEIKYQNGEAIRHDVAEYKLRTYGKVGEQPILKKY